jgi:hypothetical protein
MKVIFTLIILASVLSCASIEKTTPESMRLIKYGMHFSEVNKLLDEKGGLIFRAIWAGKHYFGVYYEVEGTFKKP